MKLRKANINDNQGLLELTRKVPMTGGLQLRIDRDPDFFEILRRSGEYITFIIEDKDVIIGSWSIVTHKVYINGSKVTLHYCRDLKLDLNYQGSLAFFRLTKYVREYQTERSADLHFTITLKGNYKAISTLGGRAGLNKFEFAGSFLLNFCLLTPIKYGLGQYQLDVNPDLAALCSFYDHFYKDYQLGPVITPDHLKDKQNLVLNLEGKAVAALTLEDPIAYRKTVVVHFSKVYKVILLIMHLLSKTGVIARPPKEGDTLKILYIKYAVHDHNRVALKKMIKYTRSNAYRSGYHFLCLGLDERDPLISFSRRLPGLKVKVLSYISSLQGSRQYCDDIRKGILFEDHALT